MTITIADGRGALWQWDTGRRLRVGSGVDQIHYQNRVLGGIYNADGQMWECFQAYDNATHPDIQPSKAAWYTFNRPLHGTSVETARPFVQPTSAHDVYKAGEYMIWTDGKTYRCKADTAYSPVDYAAAWEVTA